MHCINPKLRHKRIINNKLYLKSDFKNKGKIFNSKIDYLTFQVFHVGRR